MPSVPTRWQPPRNCASPPICVRFRRCCRADSAPRPRPGCARPYVRQRRWPCRQQRGASGVATLACRQQRGTGGAPISVLRPARAKRARGHTALRAARR
jgi:hypothetical protein